MNNIDSGGALETAKRIAAIRQLNDQLRTTGRGGTVLVTAGVAALSPHEHAAVVSAVAAFSDFGAHNDPYGEHDCGSLQAGSNRVIWKIDYYDQSLLALSPDPADPEATKRVMTIMLAGEY